MRRRRWVDASLTNTDDDPRLALVYQEALRGLLQQQAAVERLHNHAATHGRAPSERWMGWLEWRNNDLIADEPRGTQDSAYRPTAADPSRRIGDGLNPLTMSQMPSDASQAISGSVAMNDGTEVCS